MAGGVEQDSPGSAGLVVRHGCAQLDAARLVGGDVVAGEIEVELLAAMLVGPRRGPVLLDLTEAECDIPAGEHGVLVLQMGDLPAQQRRPELRQRADVGAVEGDHLQRRSVHAAQCSYAHAVPDRTNATSTTAGILRPEELAVHADVQRVACAEQLSPWVENHWCLRWELPPGATYVSSTLPHPACNLSVEHGAPRPGVGLDRVVVTGVVTRRFDVTLTERGWVLGVKFRPGGLAALCPIDARDLADEVVPAVQLLPADVCEAMRSIRVGSAPVEAAAAADEALLDLVPDEPNPAYSTVLTLIADMLEDRAIVRVAQLEERHGIGRRQVQRLFARYVGVGPKWVLSRYRMHDVVTALDEGYRGSLTELAAQYGWYDQAHFNRDFIGQVGVTPSEYRTRARRLDG